MKKIALMITFLMISSMCFAASPDFVRYYSADLGKVTFNHMVHSENNTCDKCHLNGVIDAIPPMSEDLAHMLCSICHTGEGQPKTCKECHKK